MEIKHIQEEGNSRFEILEDGKVVGELVYDIPFPDRLIIKHTSISPTVSGKGYGKELIKKSVSLAKVQNLEVIPVCAFAAKMKKDHPELFD